MLQKLRDQTQSTGFQILVVAIIAVLVLFGFGATNLFLAGDPEIAQVGDYEITQNVLSVETERERRRLLAQMGEGFDSSQIDPLQMQQYALQQLINRQVLYQTAENAGVAVPPDVVNANLVESPAYHVDGRFDETVYRQQLQMMGYAPVEFIELYQQESNVDQLRSAVVESAYLTDWELAEIVRVINQQRDVAYLPLTVEQFKAGIEIADEAIALRYEEEQSAYMTAPAVDAQYVRLSVEDLLDDESIVVEEEELLSLYDDDRAAALRDEQRDSSHILVQVNEERNEDQALELITEIRTRILAGEDFADLAEELSEDPGSAAQGGALGAVGKGIFDPAFEEALWALGEPGAMTEPVLSSFGYHLIRLEAIVERDYPEFESVRADLETRVRRLKAEDLFAEKVQTLEEIAYDERTSLAGSAGALDLEVVNVAGVSREDNQGDAAFDNTNVLDALFSPSVQEGENSDLLELSDTAVMIARVEQVYDPEPIPLEEVTEQIRETLTREQALGAIEEAQARGMARLRAGESVAEIAEDLGSQWRSFPLISRVGRSNDIPRAVVDVAFELPRPAAGEKAVGQTPIDDGAALVTVTRVVQGDMGTTTAAEIVELRRIAAQRSGRVDYESFFSAARERIGVTQPLADADA